MNYQLDFPEPIILPDHQIWIGDGIELLEDIESNSIPLIAADLPYGTTKNSWDTVLDLKKLWVQYKRILMQDGCILLFAQSPFNITLAASNMAWYRYEWIWEKTNATGHLNAKRMPMKAHENVLVFYKNLPTYNPQKTTGHVRKVSTADHKRNSKDSTNYGKSVKVGYDSTERYPRSVLTFPSDKQKSKYHPTQKPVPLLEYFINTYSNEGDTVLDNTCGSGTTGVAAKKTGRRSILIDNNPEMLPIIEHRLITLI